MGSEGTVEAYVKAVRVFVKYLGYQDPETALTALKSGEVDASRKSIPSSITHWRSRIKPTAM